MIQSFPASTERTPSDPWPAPAPKAVSKVSPELPAAPANAHPATGVLDFDEQPRHTNGSPGFHTSEPYTNASSASNAMDTMDAIAQVAPVGSHCILELHDCSAARLDDEQWVRDTLAYAAERARSTLLSLTSHRFEPQGVTSLALLAESHISIHTWPELGYAAVDVFTCGEHTDPRAACEAIAIRMGATSHSLREIRRGAAYAADRVPA